MMSEEIQRSSAKTGQGIRGARRHKCRQESGFCPLPFIICINAFGCSATSDIIKFTDDTK